MLTRMPDYYDQFRCLAGECPHTCCAKWEVVIDEDSADRYARVEGPLGDKLRSALTRDADGDLCFPLKGERCPFLDTDNLCEIHRQLGEEATSVTCREHPRLTEDYGAFREITLSASCPAANALLLGSEAPLTFREQGEAEASADEELELLLALRRQMLTILTDRGRPVRQRLAVMLAFAEEAQWLLEEWDEEGLAALAAGKWTADIPEDGTDLFPDGLRLLEGLEVLEADWPDLLRAAELAPLAEVPQPLLERTAVYFAFRYLLKAINDGDLLSRARFCAFAVAAVERLAAVTGLPEALRRFSGEIEHSGDNLETLLERLRKLG